jgi:hypothetical protein
MQLIITALEQLRMVAVSDFFFVVSKHADVQRA